MVDELIAAIEADPADEASQVVIADYLQAAGDPRGDLIVLDHAERRGLLDDPAALDELLMLAAVYSFPRAEPDDPPLPFVHVRDYRHELVHQGFRYVLEGNRLYIYELAEEDPDTYDYHSLGFEIVQPWTGEQQSIVLAILSDVIRASTPFDGLRFPLGPIPLPQHAGSPLRCYMLPVEFLRDHDLLRNQYGLAARDYHRWHAIWKRLRAMQRR